MRIIFIRSIIRMIKACFLPRPRVDESALVKQRKRFLTIKEIYSRHYNNIPYHIFCEIVKADPTYSSDKPDKMGTYGKWLLSIYQKKALLIEDLSKAQDYLDCFDRYHRRFVNRSDINRIKSLPDLYVLIKDYLENTEELSDDKGNEERRIKDTEAKRLYEDEDWIVIQPLTQQTAIIYGRGTQWCTAASRSYNYFEEYNSRGPLHILISRKNNRKFQLHLNTRTYCDETDRSISTPIAESINMSIGLARFYQKLGWYDLFKVTQVEYDYPWNYFIDLDGRYYYCNPHGVIIDNCGVDSVLRYRWGNEALYLIENSNKKNCIWASSEKPMFEEWYDDVRVLDRGIIIITNGNKNRVYSLLVEMFFEDFITSNCCNFKTLCQTFASFTPLDRSSDLSLIDRMVYSQAEEPEDYREYLRIFGSSALFKKQAKLQVAVPIILCIVLVMTFIGAIFAAIGFSGYSPTLGKIGTCAFAMGIIIIGLVNFSRKTVRKLINCIVLLSVNGTLVYVLAEYGPTAFLLSILGFALSVWIVAKSLKFIKLSLNKQ